ncbi:TetR/AcrR family transcriptional regulator [Ilumatobacter sp.]|uniref:TetR/AcrR family transcriptional regulator n=1 Tax=Ilumatobacter sp. TaxID=1967498 RepID=UPI003C44103B
MTNTPEPRRRGRPPDTKSSETRAAILDGARQLFGERGYGAVTNKDLAAAAGVTTGALYHYVDSKLDLYVQVHRDMRRKIYERFRSADTSEQTFIGKLEAVLEAAHELNRDDPSLAKFVGAVRADTRRYPEIGERLGDANAEREQFFMSMVQAGVGTGEVRPEDTELLEEFVRLVLVGLTDGSSESLEQHRRAIDSLKAMVRGQLVRPPQSSTMATPQQSAS